MNKKITAVAVVAVIVIGGGWFGYSKWTSSPAYSLLQIKSAFESHDVALFEKHVDVDSLVGRAVDTVLGLSLSDTPEINDGAAAFGSALAAGMVAMMKPKVVEYAKAELTQLVEGSSDAPSGSGQDPAAKSLGKLEDLFGNGQDGLSQSYLRREGKIVYLGLERFDAELQDTLTLELKMRDMGGYWQIVEVSNLEAMIARSNELRAARLAEINAPVLQKLASNVLVTNVSKHNEDKNRWQKEVYLDATITNATGRKMTSVVVSFEIADSGGTVLRTLNGRVDQLAPGAESGARWGLDFNQFKSGDKAVYQLPDEQARFKSRVTRIEFEDGEIVELAESL